MSQSVAASIKKSTRLHWVDVCKGLLILLMVCGHIPNIAGRNGLDVTYLSKYGIIAQFYICFFMQAFFVLTGFTSNFNKDPKPFLVSACKTILIPWLSLSCILKIINGLAFQDWALNYNIGGHNYFFIFEDFWFLHALFFAKVTYYFLNRYLRNDYWLAIVLLAMMVLGFGIMLNNHASEDLYHFQNFFHYRDFLCMTLFIWVGDVFSRKSLMSAKVCNYGLIAYIVLWCTFLFMKKLHIDNMLITPIVLSHGTDIESLMQIPSFIAFVICGSLACFRVCMLIDKNKIIEYFGRNSIVIYCIHFLFLQIAVLVIPSLLTPDNLLSSIEFFALVLAFSICMSVLVILLFTIRPFNYLLGKF